jgi:septal ring factor EnvC (AmiA/AmiB activator)
MLTSLGIGEALVSALDEKGKPTPLAATMMRAPMSRMDVLTDSELKTLVAHSKLTKKYNETVDRESAYELLNEKIKKAEAEEAKEKAKQEEAALKKAASKRQAKSKSTSRSRSTRMNPIVKVLTSATFIRSVFGILTKVLKK